LKARIFLSVCLVLFDIFLLPWIITFLPLFLEHNIQAPTLWIDSFSLLDIALVFNNEAIRTIWITCQGLIALGFLLLFWKDVPKKKYKLGELGGPEAAGHGEHGTSRVQTDKEIDSTSTVWFTNNPLEKGGAVLGMVPYNTHSTKKMNEIFHKVWLDTQDTHTLLIGTTRSGKSRRNIIPAIWTNGKAGESMIITDPKGELYTRTQSYLREKGYEIVLLDFRTPTRGNHWNPMDGVNQAIQFGDISQASKIAWDIASMISPVPIRGDDIWANGTQSVLAATILAISMEADSDEKKHLGSVYQMLIELGKPMLLNKKPFVPLNHYFDSLPMGHIAKSAFGTASLAPTGQRGSFYTGAAAKLRLWSDPNIAFMTSKQDHEMQTFGEKKTAVFLVIPDEETTYHVLASLYINQAYQALISSANRNEDRLKIRTNFLLDEFGNLPVIPNFDTKITVSLGRGIRFTLVVQSIDQLRNHYRDSVKTILGNCHTWIYLLTTDQETAEEVSKRTGKYTIESESTSSTVQQKGYTRGFSSGTTGRPLFDANEILRWPEDKALVLRARQHPAVMNAPDLSVWQADRDFVKNNKAIEKDSLDVSYYIPDIWNENEVFEEEQLLNELDQEKENDSELEKEDELANML
jgi:type IV secretion system protein VirD4